MCNFGENQIQLWNEIPYRHRIFVGFPELSDNIQHNNYRVVYQQPSSNLKNEKYYRVLMRGPSYLVGDSWQGWAWCRQQVWPVRSSGVRSHTYRESLVSMPGQAIVSPVLFSGDSFLVPCYWLVTRVTLLLSAGWERGDWWLVRLPVATHLEQIDSH